MTDVGTVQFGGGAPGRHPGPQIWLQGDPAELEGLLDLGISGIITNTIILADLTARYGQLRDLVRRYVEISGGRPIYVEVDGDNLETFMRAADAACAISPQIGIKIPSKPVGLHATSILTRRGVSVMATTCFSLSQAVVMAAAGAKWIAPFIGPTKAMGGDPMQLVREIVEAFRGRPNPPGIIGGIVRTAEAAYWSLAAGADAVVIFPEVYYAMLEHPGTDEWNATFRGKWAVMEEAGLLEGFVEAPALTSAR